jgi:hypothetical protein
VLFLKREESNKTKSAHMKNTQPATITHSRSAPWYLSTQNKINRNHVFIMFFILINEKSNIFCVGIAIFSFITLWNIMSLVLSRRSCRVCQFMVFNISDTLLVLWCLLHVYLAARRCTFSSEFMFSYVWGSQTVQQYSNYTPAKISLSLHKIYYFKTSLPQDLPGKTPTD